MPAITIAIVGAGILGCMIAREIAARTPDAALILVDRDTVGSGASRRSAGLHIPWGADDRVRQMTAFSQDYYESLKRAHPVWPIYPVGMTILAAETSAARLRDGYLDRANFSRAGNTGRWTVDGCQYADVYALTQALASELRPHVSLREGVAVTGIESTREGVVLYLGSGDTLHADRVVIAPGPWIRSIAWSSLVAPLGIRVKKIVALHLEQRPTEDDRVTMFADDDAFLLPLLRRGHWLFSYTCQEWDVDPDDLVNGLSAENIAEGRRVLGRYAPALVETCTSGRVFCDAYTTDRRPRVQTVDEAGRIVFAGAANGSGYRLAPAMATAAADLLHLPTKVRSHS